MSKKIATLNAKTALNQMKLEIANELGVENNLNGQGNSSSHDNGVIGGRVGGQMSKRLVAMGQEILLKKYNQNNK